MIKLELDPSRPAVMEARLLARDSARQSVDWSLAATAAATAAARDLAYAFGYVHPEAGTCKAIQAVLDQLDNPTLFTGNKEAYEKHGVGRGAFKRWKKHLVLDFLGTVAVDTDSNLSSALESRDARLAAPQYATHHMSSALERPGPKLAAPQGGQAVSLPPQFVAHAPSEPVVSGDMLAEAAAASGVSLVEALDKLTLPAADQHAATIDAAEKAEAEAVLREGDAADAAQDAANAAQAAADAAQVAEAATARARQAAALAARARQAAARARVAAAHVAADAAALEAAGEAAARDEAREAEQRQRAEVATSAAGSCAVDAPPLAKGDGASEQTLATGQRVCIRGLQTRTELNDTYGRVITFQAERGRYAVELEGSREHV